MRDLHSESPTRVRPGRRCWRGIAIGEGEQACAFAGLGNRWAALRAYDHSNIKSIFGAGIRPCSDGVFCLARVDGRWP